MNCNGGSMSELTVKAKDGAAGWPREVAGVTLDVFRFEIAGRGWEIRAGKDHASIMGVCDDFVAFPFGLLLWESGVALAEALADARERISGKTVLELGAGVGLPGVVARYLGAASVLQTDHVSEALTLCRINAAANGVAGVDTALANWDAWTDERAYDLIIASDVIYEREAHAPLAAILERNLRAGGRVMLADPGRQDTPLFLEEMAGHGWRTSITQRPTPSMMPGGLEVVSIDVIELTRG
jgi:SAM-dependent methyltransferase